MALGKRIARMLGTGVLGTVVVAAGLHAIEPGLLQQARASSSAPLAGTWYSLQSKAPITALRIIVLPVNVDGEPTGRLIYDIDAFGSGKNLGFRAVPVPQDPSTPVTVSYQSAGFPGTASTTLTMTLPSQFLELRVTSDSLGVTRTTNEEMTTQ
jgi:hypothetical protein